MAEFGVNATQLSAPQGAGANVVAPVQEPVVSFGIPKFVGEAVDIFAKGLVQTREEEAQALENSIVGAYIQEQAVINNGVASGQIRASEAATRYAAIGNKYLASYPQFSKSLLEADKSIRGITEKAQVERQIQTAEDLKKSELQAVQKAGYNIPSDATDEELAPVLDAYRSVVRADAEFKRFTDRQAEKRAQGTYDAAVAKREGEALGFRVVNDIGSTHIISFSQQGLNLSKDVLSGKLTINEARAQLSATLGQIEGQLTAASQYNPDVANAFRGMFREMNSLNLKMLDPTANAQEIKAERDALIARTQLVELQRNPKFLALAATSQLAPNNLKLQTSAAGSEAFLSIASQPPISGFNPNVPQIVGNPEVEKDVFNSVKNSIKAIDSGTVSNTPKAREELSNSINNLLIQTGKAMSNGTTPDQLKNAAEFFADPVYASAVQKGQVNREAADTAKLTFQRLYTPAVSEAITQRLTGPLSTREVSNNPIQVLEAIDIKFSGDGVTFVPKNINTPIRQNLQLQSELVQSLNSASKGLNQLIRITAHMEGHTDYAKQWENNKHEFLPTIFPDPAKLKPGQVVEGRSGKYRYNGGPWKLDSSYTKVD